MKFKFNDKVEVIDEFYRNPSGTVIRKVEDSGGTSYIVRFDVDEDTLTEVFSDKNLTLAKVKNV